MTIDFDAFGQHYAVELKRQTHATPSNVTHTNVAEEVHGPVSSVEESCHWQGSVSNDEGVSVVSASLCSGRGIRARISAFDEILIIKPTAYYLDLAKDALQAHGLEDEVLMYRVSEFDRPEVIGTVGVEPDADDILMEQGVNMRRRLSYTASSPAWTEVTMIIGPVRVANYQSDYGETWYSALFSDTQDMVNAVDAIYAATNWNADGRVSIGGVNALRVVFSEIHIIYAFSGIYASIAPGKRTPDDCPLADDEYDDSIECAVYSSDWLNNVASWMRSNMDGDDYDNVQILTDMKFLVTQCSNWDGTKYICEIRLGLGHMFAICSPWYSSSAVTSMVAEFGGIEGGIETMAHEMGHNFGLDHDGQPGEAEDCCADCGLMGYGTNGDTFSTCSLDNMMAYWEENGGLQCLGTGWDDNTDSTVSNVGSELHITGAPTVSPVEAPTAETTSPTPAPVYGDDASDACVNVEVGSYYYDGTWYAVDGGYNGHEAFTQNSGGYDLYLFYMDYTNWDGADMLWAMGSCLGYCYSYFCPNEDLYTCGTQWATIDSWSEGTFTTKTESVTDKECLNEGLPDNSCASYTCLLVSGAGIYDGYYSASIECSGDRRVFKRDDDKILCYNDNNNVWYFTDTVCFNTYSAGSVMSSPTTENVVSALSWWMDDEGDNYYSSAEVVIVDESQLSDCNAFASQENAAVQYGDADADDGDAEVICVVTNSSLWGSSRTFTIYNEMEANGRPIYHHFVYNESNIAKVEGVELGPEVEAEFYVHYQPLVVNGESSAQWMLTEDGISVNYVARCMKEDLLNCTENDWMIKVVDLGDFDGIVREIADEHMAVSEGECGAVDSVSDPYPSMLLIVIVVIVVVILVAGVLGFCAWFMWKKLKKKQAELMMQNAIIVDSAEDKPEEQDVVEEEVSVAAAEVALTEVGGGGVGGVHED